MEKNSLLRKVTIAFLAFAGVFAGATAQRISTTPSGDANLDFKVNEEDVTTAIDSILRGHFAYWCDVNFDEMLNASDVASIVNINFRKHTHLHTHLFWNFAHCFYQYGE